MCLASQQWPPPKPKITRERLEELVGCGAQYDDVVEASNPHDPFRKRKRPWKRATAFLLLTLALLALGWWSAQP